MLASRMPPNALIARQVISPSRYHVSCLVSGLDRPGRNGKRLSATNTQRRRVTGPGIVIDGRSLTCAGVAAVARDEARVTVAPEAAAAARAAWETAREVTAR